MIKLIIALIFTMNLFNYETQKYSVILNDDDFELLKEARRKTLNANKNFNKKRI